MFGWDRDLLFLSKSVLLGGVKTLVFEAVGPLLFFFGGIRPLSWLACVTKMFSFLFLFLVRRFRVTNGVVGDAQIVQGDTGRVVRGEEGQTPGGADEGDACQRQLERRRFQGVQFQDARCAMRGRKPAPPPQGT